MFKSYEEVIMETHPNRLLVRWRRAAIFFKNGNFVDSPFFGACGALLLMRTALDSLAWVDKVFWEMWKATTGGSSVVARRGDDDQQTSEIEYKTTYFLKTLSLYTLAHVCVLFRQQREIGGDGVYLLPLRHGMIGINTRPFLFGSEWVYTPYIHACLCACTHVCIHMPRVPYMRYTAAL